ncbi:hypothetical protein NIES2100_48150 [Calothrix sp. NIES-2100]|nr:hypothetical protein NIES2100_48150 [Calothrix sp. NIES-2100]
MGTVPILALEVVSKTSGGEYKQKKIDYAQLGILYYAIYVLSRRYRRKREPLEVYRLVEGNYILQPGSRVWMPEIALAIGRERGTYLGRTREWLYWYDQKGRKLLTPEELVQQERERADRLPQKLRDLGINAENI